MIPVSELVARLRPVAELVTRYETTVTEAEACCRTAVADAEAAFRAGLAELGLSPFVNLPRDVRGDLSQELLPAPSEPMPDLDSALPTADSAISEPVPSPAEPPSEPPAGNDTPGEAAKACLICGKEFTPLRRTQVICYDKECRRKRDAQFTAASAARKKQKAGEKPEPEPAKTAPRALRYSPEEAVAHLKARREKSGFTSDLMQARSLGIRNRAFDEAEQFYIVLEDDQYGELMAAVADPNGWPVIERVFRRGNVWYTREESGEKPIGRRQESVWIPSSATISERMEATHA
jgi:hypothetical protein